MLVCIELFLLDNTLMNGLILALSAAVSGFRLRRTAAICCALTGAVYALLAMSCLPLLLHPVFKLTAGLLMALPFRFHGKYGYLKSLGALFFSAFVIGGTLFGITLLFGGKLQQGTLIGSVPTRIALIAMVLCALLPGFVRMLHQTRFLKDQFVRLRLTQSGRQKEMQALIDTGNHLREPLSGLPVIIVQKADITQCGKPVPYSTIAGTGILNALRPERIELFDRNWVEIDAMIASSPYPIENADAIIGTNALPFHLKIK